MKWMIMKLAMMYPELGQHGKLAVAGLLAFGAFLANVVQSVVQDDAWKLADDLTLKAVLFGAVIWLWRVWQAERADREKDRTKHEERMETIVKANTESNEAVVTTLGQQVKFFDQLNTRLVDRAMTDHGREKP